MEAMYAMARHAAGEKMHERRSLSAENGNKARMMIRIILDVAAKNNITPRLRRHGALGRIRTSGFWFVAAPRGDAERTTHINQPLLKPSR